MPPFDGIIFAGVSQKIFNFARALPQRNPVFWGGDPKVSPVVALEDEAAGAMAAEHLIECRLERFAFYGTKGHPVYPVRLAGFEHALR